MLTSSFLVLEKDWLLKSTVKINPTLQLIPTTVIISLFHMSSVHLFMQFFKNIPNIKLSFFGINKLSSIIKVQKDPLPLLSHSNVEHCLEFSHDFDWDKVEILDEKIHFNKKIISEMVHIKKQSYDLNLQHDTESLDSIYFDIIR